MCRLKEIWLLLLLFGSVFTFPSAAKLTKTNNDSLKAEEGSETRGKNLFSIKTKAMADLSSNNKNIKPSNQKLPENQEKRNNLKKFNADFETAFIRESLHPTIVPFPLLYKQIFGNHRSENSKLFIHKFGNLRNLISQKHWIEIQAILNQKTPLRSKHFEITKILAEQIKLNKSQIQIFWNDFFDFHVMKKVLMLHNKILQSFGQKSIENYGIYDVEISVETKVKLLNAQIKRYLPEKDYKIYLRIQKKVFELSKGEKDALLL